MKTPSLEFLAGTKRPNVGTWRGLVSVVALLTSVSACNNPTRPPETGQVSFDVRFLTPPLALSTIVATLTSSGLQTVPITLTPVSGTDNRQWTGGPNTVTAATYNVDIQGKDLDATVTYRGSGTIIVGAGSVKDVFFALVCVSTRCETTTGTVTLMVLTPQLEVEPNGSFSTANVLTPFQLFGGQFDAGLANGVITPGSPADVDFYSFNATGLANGDSIFVVLYAKTFGSTLQGIIQLTDATGQSLGIAFGGASSDPVIAYPVAFNTASTATYMASVRGSTNPLTTGSYTVLVYHCKPGNANGANAEVCR